MHYYIFETAFGYCGIGWHAHGIRHLMLPEASVQSVEFRIRQLDAKPVFANPSGTSADIVAATERYFAGEKEVFQLAALDLSDMSPFNKAVYTALIEVSYGQTTTYGALAKMAGYPDAARGAGAALGANPLPLLIPCHRVVSTGGKLGGFSAPGGKLTKQKMLMLEQASLPADNPAQTSFTF